MSDSTRSNNQSKHQPNPALDEVTLSTEPIFDGKVIRVQVDTVRLPNGETGKREIVRHNGAVAVLAIHNDRMIVVDQYRQPLGRTQVEIPAGKLEPGEDPADAIARELKEETGYTAKELKLLYSFYTSPGFADELIHLYLADELEQGEAQLDEDEFLEMSAITLEEAYEQIRAGRISDAKTIMAVQAWHLIKQGVEPK
ncbi:NUDIX domain-containing protein [Paenibacillus hunanensis]|uniref:ADP-ribose pyrophosphatase n=1 Tax=Paenibacillus hunanensis TaxID=539262 RepID=A0ABU1IVH5_9BACL|nr:NUDIX hydrolase [Paenibacillus hunanensis]MDR6243273.1 ADP-ribose pyrophosphatase [Paenibacillus hunanensis]GGJ10507.1 ADP-ribose pyrophosphatase [Paenibacillus hunanensis]